MKRRQFVQTLGAGSAVAGLGLVSGCAGMGGSSAKVVVVGGGFGGATAAKYVRLFSDYGIQVTLVDPRYGGPLDKSLFRFINRFDRPER